ncbi:MAG TPA: DUF6624 domain-containing protein [Longimicrobiaceae bacterium]|nr:DUF6624 domain-containing protein [Longimicrobiaceae bacterium]
MDRTRRAALLLLAAFILGGACAAAPLPAQQQGTQTMQPALDALLRALQAKDFSLLAPYLDDSYRAGEVAGPVARQLLQQVVDGGMRVASAIAVDSAAAEGEHVRVSARFAFEDGERPLRLLLTREGKFVEVPLFQVQWVHSGGAAPGMTHGGLRVRQGEGGPPPGSVPPQTAAPRAAANPELQQELVRMGELDQRHRGPAAGGARPATDPETVRLRAETDRANLRRLEEIIAEHGWPGASLVGEDGSRAAFLVLQHADPATQERYLPLLREAAEQGELAPAMLAMLEDRVRMRRGEMQLYGTQLRGDPASGRLTLWPIEDEANVDARRARVGLPPLADYLRNFGIEYAPPAARP